MLKVLIRSKFGNQIDKIQRMLGKKDKTYAEEFSTLNEILFRIGQSKGFTFVDIGAGDGFNMSIAFPLEKYFDAEGLLIEPDEESLNNAKNLYRKRNFSFASEFVTPSNSVRMLTDAGYLNPFYLKVDIDSFDLEIVRSLFEGGIKPKIFSIEINELLPPPIRFEILYKEDLPTLSHPLRGCSLQSAYDLAIVNNYFLHSLAYNNAFFVSNEFESLFSSRFLSSISDVYQTGFQFRDWSKLFPWDVKYKDWLEKTPHELRKEIKRLTYFDSTYMKLD